MRRNEPRAPYHAHLFKDAVVKSGGAALDTDEVTDRPIRSVCGRANSRGPFAEADPAVAIRTADGDDDENLCASCARIWWANELRERAEDDGGPPPDR